MDVIHANQILAGEGRIDHQNPGHVDTRRPGNPVQRRFGTESEPMQGHLRKR